MIRILIYGTELTSLICAHSILDILEDVEIHLIDSKAEVGLLEEGPGIIPIDSWPVLPEEWCGKLGSQQPSTNSTAVRRSWFEKSCATRLAERGAIFHLRTTTEKIGKSTIKFEGAGPQVGSSLTFDIIINQIKPPHNSPIWKGGTHSSGLISSSISGKRSDGLIEEWWDGETPIRSDWLQLMEWKGPDPRNSLRNDIETGRRLASKVISL